MFIANDLKQIKTVYKLDSIRESFMENLFIIVENFFSDKNLFSPEDFTFYVNDEHILRTNCHDNIFTCIYLEINQPNNYKPNFKKKLIKINSNKPSKYKHNKYKIPDLYIQLSDIRKGLCESALKHFDSNTIVWQDKYSVLIKSSIIENDKKYDYFFKIIPALTYYNNDNTRGLVYYSGNDVQIEYPTKFFENYCKKNKQTKDMYRQIILILKNILLKEKDFERLPSEIIETLVYNVPNSMLLSDNKENIINIINFIRNNPMRDFKTIDEQDYAFSSLYRGMSAFYSRHVLKTIEKAVSKM